MNFIGLRDQLDRTQRWVLVALAVTILSASAIAMWRHTPALDANTLDRPMLAMEIPRSVDELRSIALRGAETEEWASIIRWDYVFIAGYVLLFVTLKFRRPPGDEKTAPHFSLWESIIPCALATAAADVYENLALVVCLHDISVGRNLAGTRASTALPVLGAAKWLLFFLTCRAVAIQFGRPHWRWFAVLLRALATAGAWATVLALIGLPGRPVIAAATDGTTLVLLAAAVAMAARNGLADPSTTPAERPPTQPLPRDERTVVLVTQRFEEEDRVTIATA